MMHDPDTLASAYLDGELTDDERRAAEADPAVMAEVEQLRALRAGIADVEPPSADAREAAIGAAMAAFHEQFATTTPATTPATPPTASAEPDAVVVPMWQRFASPQWLGTAAAALVLVVGVGVVATRTGGDDDGVDMAGDEATSEIMADEEPADDALDLPAADADRIAESEMADDVFAAEAESDDMGAADMVMADEPAEEPAEESADDFGGDDMDAGDAEMADDAESDGEDATGSAGPPALDDPALHFEFDVPIVGPLQLRAAGWYLLDQRDDGVLGPTPEYRCEFYNVLGSALFDVDGEIRQVLLEFDEADPTDRVLYAVDRDGCLVVATVELDRP